MNYPMKDGQIDPEFLERISEKTEIGMCVHVIGELLLTAQEVMQEIQPEPGQRVEHKKTGKQGLLVYVTHSGQGAKVLWDGKNEAGGIVKTKNLIKIKEAQHGEG